MTAFCLVSIVIGTFSKYQIENFILMHVIYIYITMRWDCSADLDDTLYPLSSGLANACLKNIKGEELCIIVSCAKIFSVMSFTIAPNFSIDMRGTIDLRLHGGGAWHRTKENWWLVQPPLQ